MQRLVIRAIALLSLIGATGCPWYKPEIVTNKCVTNDQCGEGFACREGRCEDIYYPKRKIRQY